MVMTLSREAQCILSPYKRQKNGRLPVSTGEFCDARHGGNGFQNGVHWSYLEDYIENGSNAQEWRRGRDQFAEIAVQRLMQTWIGWHYNHRVITTSLSPFLFGLTDVEAREFHRHLTELLTTEFTRIASLLQIL